MFKFIFVSVVFFTFCGAVFAQNNEYANNTEPTTQSAITLTPVTKPFLVNPQITAGFKSYNNQARERELLEPSGRRFKSKNEFSIGFKDSQGWGAQFMAVETLETKGKSSLNKFAPADPSLTLYHPILKTENFKLTGAFRQYFPVSDRSVTQHIWQHAYYLTFTLKMANKMEWVNILTPRYFTQDYYKPTDASFYIENWSTLTKPFEAAKWLRVGAGMHHQAEVHPGSPTGVVMDIYPLVDFMLSSNIHMGPRVYLPTFVNGNVNDAAKKVSLSEAQLEFYLQATL